jgi:hypothetical protein
MVSFHSLLLANIIRPSTLRVKHGTKWSLGFAPRLGACYTGDTRREQEQKAVLRKDAVP